MRFCLGLSYWCRKHSGLHILGARRVIRSKLHTEDPQFCSDLWPSLLLGARELIHIFVCKRRTAVIMLKTVFAVVRKEVFWATRRPWWSTNQTEYRVLYRERLEFGIFDWLSALFRTNIIVTGGLYSASRAYGYWVTPGVDHSPPSSAEVRERVELYFHSPPLCHHGVLWNLAVTNLS